MVGICPSTHLFFCFSFLCILPIYSRALSDTKSFEIHCCKHRRREANGWGGMSAASDAREGNVLPESTLRAFMHQRMRNNVAIEKWRVGDLSSEILSSVGRSFSGDPSGVVAGRS